MTQHRCSASSFTSTTISVGPATGPHQRHASKASVAHVHTRLCLQVLWQQASLATTLSTKAKQHTASTIELVKKHIHRAQCLVASMLPRKSCSAAATLCQAAAAPDPLQAQQANTFDEKEQKRTRQPPNKQTNTLMSPQAPSSIDPRQHTGAVMCRQRASLLTALLEVEPHNRESQAEHTWVCVACCTAGLADCAHFLDLPSNSITQCLEQYLNNQTDAHMCAHVPTAAHASPQPQHNFSRSHTGSRDSGG